MFVEEIELRNQEYEQLNNDRQRLEDQLTANTTRRDEYRNIDASVGILYRDGGDLRARMFSAAIEAMRNEFLESTQDVNADQYNRALPEENLRSSLRAHMDHIYHGMINNINSIEERVRRDRRNMTTIRERLEGMDSTPTIYRRSEIEAQLVDVENYIPGTVALTSSRAFGSTHNLVTFELQGGWAQVTGLDLDDMPWFHVEHDDFRVPYGDCLVCINLANNGLQLKPRTDTSLRPYTWEGLRTIHPHVLNNHGPCLGDFSGPMTEAIADKDWPTVVGLINLYLGRVDATDSAGAHWTHWFAREFGDTRVNNRVRRRSSEFRGYKHYFMEDGIWVMKLSKHPHEFEEASSADEAIEQIIDDLEPPTIRPVFDTGTDGPTATATTARLDPDYFRNPVWTNTI